MKNKNTKSGNISEMFEKNTRKKSTFACARPLALLLACALLTAGCLAGCGDASQKDNSANTSSAQADTASAQPDPASAETETSAKSDESAALEKKDSAADQTAAQNSTSAAADQAAAKESTAAAAVSDSAAENITASAADPSANASAEDSAGKLRKLKYIDAWEEWHTMEVDPAVKETLYDADKFIHPEENPQWVVYTGSIAGLESVAEDKSEQASQESAGTQKAALPEEQLQSDTQAFECLQGIDVSEHQGAIDWQAVADAGYRFAFIRVGFRGYGEEGKLVEDAMAVENLQRAKAVGLQVGTYFFSQALNEEEAAEEAALAVSVIEKSGVETDLPLVYDPELIKDDWGRANEITREQVALNTAAFRDAAESASSCKVDIYSNLPWEHNYFDAETMNAYDIWYADYEPFPQTPYHFTWWQYTNEGSVPGIEGPVDLNLWIRKK